jgi:hypothetical protein
MTWNTFCSFRCTLQKASIKIHYGPQNPVNYELLRDQLYVGIYVGQIGCWAQSEPRWWRSKLVFETVVHMTDHVTKQPAWKDFNTLTIELIQGINCRALVFKLKNLIFMRTHARTRAHTHTHTHTHTAKAQGKTPTGPHKSGQNWLTYMLHHMEIKQFTL